MAFNTEATASSTNFKRFYGDCEAELVAINPDLKTYNELNGTQFEKEPNYFSEQDGVKNARVELWFRITDNEDNGNAKGTCVPMTFFMSSAPAKFEKSGKTMIIDKYGQTAYATEEDLKNKAIPQYKNGPATIDPVYRTAYMGEGDFKTFLRKLLYGRGKVEIKLNMNNLFNGDDKEVRALLKDKIGSKIYCNVYLRENIKVKEDGAQVSYFSPMVYNKSFEYANERATMYYINHSILKDMEYRGVNISSDHNHYVLEFGSRKEYYTISSIRELTLSQKPMGEGESIDDIFGGPTEEKKEVKNEDPLGSTTVGSSDEFLF